ncbi:NnrS family protein [Aliikangiella maris]|uniref:NnrS family protein n=2 Tax=Aliikangiella maris TaxID=3162458 RepID=A0ABV2BXI7_9GAMM
MPLNINSHMQEDNSIPLFRLAFRPLFLFGTLFAVVAISWWVHFWLQPSGWLPYGGHIFWHAHEMLFGFGMAIVAGFLLTAVKAWTGVPTITGSLLALFFLLWLAGRILMSVDIGAPAWFIAVIDVSFMLIAAAAMGYPIVKVKQWRNLMFIPIMLAFASLNAISHWAVATNDFAFAMQALHTTVIVLVLIIAILGGRVIPAFTANGTGRQAKRNIQWLETVSIVSIIFCALIALTGFDNVPSILLLVASLIAAASNGYRFARWGIEYTISTPLLWSLHFSFIFIPLGFLMLALQSLGMVASISAALHCFTVGAMGGMILAMISRVTLGHTGRNLIPPKLLSVAYISIILATLIRVTLPAWLPEYYQMSIRISGILWVLAFVIYLFFYAPMLVTRRIDGRPG